jgi:hypothetical protein
MKPHGPVDHTSVDADGRSELSATRRAGQFRLERRGTSRRRW